jgi:hypothetical protein
MKQEGFIEARESTRLFLYGWDVKILARVVVQKETRTIENWICYKELG